MLKKKMLLEVINFAWRTPVEMELSCSPLEVFWETEPLLAFTVCLSEERMDINSQFQAANEEKIPSYSNNKVLQESSNRSNTDEKGKKFLLDWGWWPRSFLPDDCLWMSKAEHSHFFFLCAYCLHQ